MGRPERTAQALIREAATLRGKPRPAGWSHDLCGACGCTAHGTRGESWVHVRLDDCHEAEGREGVAE